MNMMRIAYSVTISLFLSFPIFSSIDDYFRYSIEPSAFDYLELLKIKTNPAPRAVSTQVNNPPKSAWITGFFSRNQL